MLEQQLQVSPDQLNQESEVNWSRVQKLYHHTAKIINPPEPDFFGPIHLDSDKYSLHDFQLVLREILKEVKVNNSKQIQVIQSKFTEEIDYLQKRIQKLENLLLELKPGFSIPNSVKEQQNQNYHTPVSKSEHLIKQQETAQTKLKEVKSFIYIEDREEEKQISLLDDEEKIGSPKRQSKKLYTPQPLKQQNQMISSLTRPLSFRFQEENEEHLINRKRIFNSSCKFHEKELRELKECVLALKSYLERVYDIKISDIPEQFCNPSVRPFEEKDYSNSRVIVNVSTNSEQHLINQNQALRRIIKKYRLQLMKSKTIVNQVAATLWEGLEKGHRAEQ